MPASEKTKTEAVDAVRKAMRDASVRCGGVFRMRAEDAEAYVGTRVEEAETGLLHIIVSHEPRGDSTRAPIDPYAVDANAADHRRFDQACATVKAALWWCDDCHWESRGPAESYVWIRPILPA